MRILTWSALILAILLLLAAALLFVAWPSLLTGSSCDLTVDAIEVDDDGWIRMRYRARIAYDTELHHGLSIRKEGLTSMSRTSLESCAPRFLRWPRTETGAMIATPGLAATPVLPDGRPDLPALRARLVLTPGTYRLRPAEELVYYRGKSRDGQDIEGVITLQYSR
jgi:hypothetical protein